MSNGNLVNQGDLNNDLHFTEWNDPWNKPCYLFALVAGDLGVLSDKFVTKSGKSVDLKIYSEKVFDFFSKQHQFFKIRETSTSVLMQWIH